MLKVAIYDSDTVFITELSAVITGMLCKSGIEGYIAIQSDDIYDVHNCIEKKAVDLIFLEFSARKRDKGLFLAHHLQRMAPGAHIVLMTDGYDCNELKSMQKAFSFMEKPLEGRVLEDFFVSRYKNAPDSYFSSINESRI